MRKKFKVVYPQGHEKAGQRFKREGCFVVMTDDGIFLLVDKSDYYTHVTKLSSVLPEYDVIWAG